MLTFDTPLNNLSFGHVAFNILERLHARSEGVNLFLKQEPPDLSSFSLKPDFKKWLNDSWTLARTRYSVEDPSLKLWHIHGGSEQRIGRNQTLLTFHEVDALTPYEINVLRNQDRVLFTSQFSCEVAKAHGLNNTEYCPLGFDAVHFKPLPRASGPIQFSLFGKFEKRKHTENVIRYWCEKYGRDSRYTLNLHVYNPFFSPEQNNALMARAFAGQKPFNVNIVPYSRTLAEFNESLNNADIVIDMSGGEGFSIPSFSAVCLGKHAVINCCSSLADWAPQGGACLVKPAEKIDVYDGVFFRRENPFGQGRIFGFDPNGFIDGCERAIKKFEENPVNQEGLKLKDIYTYDKTLDIILKKD